jgi:hypothetical protein
MPGILLNRVFTANRSVTCALRFHSFAQSPLKIRDCAFDSDGLRTGRPGFNSRRGQALRPALGRSQPPIEWLPGVSFPRGRAADYFHLLSRARMVDVYLPDPTRLHGVVLNRLCTRTHFYLPSRLFSGYRGLFPRG